MALLAGMALVVDWLRPLPDAWFAEQEHRRVLDRDGGTLAQRPVPDRGHELWVDLPDVSPHVLDALLAAEDDRFYEHRGFDGWAVGRAMWANLGAGRVLEGASTLSQQTARLLAGRRRGLVGKLLEAYRAAKLEGSLGKDEILTWYLNRAYFGRGAYGIEAAARVTFDEGAGSLSVSEAALLVGVLPAPSVRHPSVDPAAARRARDHVIERMVATGRLSREQADLALEEPIQVRSRRPGGLAPHFVARLLDGASSQTGAEVHTTLDARLQRDVEELVTKRMAALGGREVDHAAVVVVHVPSSEVRAWVGSADFGADDGQVDGARALRSPGSALKPFIYGMAFEAGWRPSDVVNDAETRFSTDHGTWAPSNYDGVFRGSVRLREALAGSYNVPAVVLLEHVGVATVQARLQAIGIALPEPAGHYGLGLALGDAGVTLEALTAAYAGLARGGEYRPLVSTVAASAPPEARPLRFLSRRAAFLVSDVLSDPVARVPTFGRRSVLARPYRASVKTGTSTAFRDNWTLGYTQEWAVGVWVGNFDGRPMGEVSGVTGAGPLWAAVMDRVTDGQAAPLPVPDALVRRTTCATTGGAAVPRCLHTVDDFAPADEPERPVCQLHGDAIASPGTGGIAYPASGAVLYIDPRMPVEAQRIPLRAVVPAGAERLAWFAEEALVDEVAAGTTVLWQPPRGGVWTLSLRVDGELAGSVAVDVRGAVASP